MFGFLRSLDGQLIGNQALWDQHLAIKWVHDNIGAFYGNYDDITIFGESGGSVSSLYQAIYPGNKGLFTRVIAQSGLPTKYFGSQVSNAEHFIEQTKCAQNKTDALNCLLSLSPDELHVDHGTLTSMPFRPTIDGDFVKGTPQEIILGKDVAFSAERDFFGSLDIVFGVNNLEGGTVLTYNDKMPDDFSSDTFNMSREIFDTMITNCIRTMVPHDGDIEEEVIRKLAEFTYIDWDQPDDLVSLRDGMVDVAGDITMVAPNSATANAHAKLNAGKTYTYLFTAKPSQPISPSAPKWLNGRSNLMFNTIYLLV